MNKRGILAIVVIFGGLFVFFLAFAFLTMTALNPDGFGAGDNRIGVVEIEGPIVESKDTLKQLRQFAEDESIQGILVRINSPGGAVSPSQEMYEAVKRIKKEKPLVVSMGSVAASGGYYIACGADTIFANPGSITGSIGVISQFFNVQGVVDYLRVDVTTLKTGKYKDSGSPFRQFDEQDERYFRTLIEDIFEQFVSDVAQSRNMERGAVLEVADGRVFTGRQAHRLDLIDELGTIEDALEFLAKEAKLAGKPTLVYPEEDQISLFGNMLKGAVDSATEAVQSKGTPSVEYRYVGPL